MKSISQVKFEVHQDGKRIDKKILNINFHNGQVCFTDKKSRVHWGNYGFEGLMVYVECGKIDD